MPAAAALNANGVKEKERKEKKNKNEEGNDSGHDLKPDGSSLHATVLLFLFNSFPLGVCFAFVFDATW